jgi:hypothetical protein
VTLQRLGKAWAPAGDEIPDTSVASNTTAKTDAILGATFFSTVTAPAQMLNGFREEAIEQRVCPGAGAADWHATVGGSAQSWIAIWVATGRRGCEIG